MKSIAPSLAVRPGIRKRFWLALALVGMVLLLGLVAFLLQTEPAYQGRRLTSWMEDLPPVTIISSTPSQTFFVFRSSQTFRAQNGQAVLTKQIETQTRAGEAVRHMGRNALPALARIVRHQDSALSRKLLALAAKQSILKLKLFSADQRRNQAYAALIELGAVAEPVWTELLLDEELPENTRQTAARSLGMLGSQAERALPGLFYTSMKYRGELANTARESILHIGAEAATPVLIQNLSAPNALVRSNAAVLLQRFGQTAHRAIPALLKGIEDQDPGVRAAIATALRNCEPHIVLSLTRSLKYDPPTFRAGAAVSLGLHKQNPELAVPALIQSMEDKESQVRESAACALGDFGVEARAAVPALRRACTDTNKEVRMAATNALQQIGPSSVTAR